MMGYSLSSRSLWRNSTETLPRRWSTSNPRWVGEKPRALSLLLGFNLNPSTEHTMSDEEVAPNDEGLQIMCFEEKAKSILTRDAICDVTLVSLCLAREQTWIQQRL